MPKLSVGDSFPTQSLVTLGGERISVPSTSHDFVHLELRRFAGCPVCNLHVREVARRHDELTAAGVLEVAVFHSEAETMRPFHGDLPFAVVADPEKHLYRALGVESSLASVMDPRAWGGLVRGMFASHPQSAMKGEGGHMGLPADFVVARDGTVVGLKYGAHADDQLSVDEVLAIVADARKSTKASSLEDHASPPA